MPTRRGAPAAAAVVTRAESAAPSSGASEASNSNIVTRANTDLLGEEITLLDTLKDVLINKERKENAYHIHFGAGKLGMGLVLPAMEQSGVSYAVIQRPSKAWTTLGSRSSIEQGEREAVGVVVNGKDVVDGMKLFTDTVGQGGGGRARAGGKCMIA
jgi:hypothetical protein